MLAAEADRVAQFARARETGDLDALMATTSFKAMVAIGAVIDTGELELARAMLDSHAGTHAGGSFSAIASMLGRLPALDPDAPGFVDRPDADCQIAERPGAGRVLFVFCGHAHRVGVPLNLLHRWLAPLGTHLVYLRDFRRGFYLAGVKSLDGGLAGLPGRLERIAADLGATEMATLGSSGGTYAALRIGSALGAAAMLSLGGPTTLSRLHDEIARRAGAEDLDPAALVAAALPLPLPGARPWPPTRLAFAGDNEVDRWQAERMQGVSNVELWPVEGWPHHAIMGPLAESGALAEHFDWLAGRRTAMPQTVAGRAAAAPEAATAGREPTIPLDSAVGRERLARSGGPAFAALSANCVAQGEPGFCGIASALTVLRALGLAPDIAEAANTPEVVAYLRSIGAGDLAAIAGRRGLTLSQVAGIFPADRVRAETVQAAATDFRGFRERAVDCLGRPGRFVIVNFERRRLGQPGLGHHSPLAAYDRKSDSFLVYDVLSDKTPPCWVKTKQLFAAMKAKSRVKTERPRGFILVGAREATGPGVNKLQDIPPGA